MLFLAEITLVVQKLGSFDVVLYVDHSDVSFVGVSVISNSFASYMNDIFNSENCGNRNGKECGRLGGL